MHWFRSFATLAIPLSVIAACGDDEPSGPPTSFTATLSGTRRCRRCRRPRLEARLWS